MGLGFFTRTCMSRSLCDASTSSVRTARSCFFLGTASHPVYVDHLPPACVGRHLLPVVMIHGGFHTGVSYLGTPDGRDGWAQLFAARGHAVHVPDWPGHGRSPGVENLVRLTTHDVATALATVIDAIGPAIVVAHSAGGPIAWWIAEHHPDKVAAIIGIAPGAPANLLNPLPDDPAAIETMRHDREAGCPVYSPLDRPVSADRTFINDFWASSPRFPRDALESYAASVVPDSPIVLNERFNIGGRGLQLASLSVVGQRPILIVTGEHDARHPKSVDQALARRLNADFTWLPDIGLNGNGHMLMIESNSHEVASVLIRWLESRNL